MWDRLSKIMDAAIDRGVGDDILYARKGTSAFKPVKGFVLPFAESQVGDAADLDQILGVRRRVKIQKATLVMQTGDKVRHPMLGDGTWMIMNPQDDEETQGRYLISDVQRTSK